MRSTEDTSLRNSWAGAPWYLLLGYVNDVIALADALNLDTFAVLGVPGGGPFALACAAKIPERVRCCGLMSAIGPLALPHSMDDMASVNRIFFTLGRFMSAVIAAFVSRQWHDRICSLCLRSGHLL